MYNSGASGNVLRSEIVGAIKMRVYLSGMPELRLGLNDKVNMNQKYIRLSSTYPNSPGYSSVSNKLSGYFKF